MKKFLIFHLDRSGGHAIINWLNNMSDSYLHLNDCMIKGGEIITTGICNDNGNIRLFGDDYDLSKFDTIIYNFEDKEVEKVKNYKAYKYIVILRDPYNCIASRYKKSLDGGITGDLLYAFPNDLFLQHVNCSYAYTISYNQWFSDRCYRVKVANDLGFTYHDSGINSVHWYGKSSFDGYDFDGKASQMKVLSRWKEFKDNIKLWSQLTPAVKEFASKYFKMDVSQIYEDPKFTGSGDNVLIYRNHDGLGDWIMTMTFIKLLNKSYPGLNVYLRITNHKNEYMPKIVQHVYGQFNCNIKSYITASDVNSNSNSNLFTYDSNHLVYDRQDTNNFIESMVNEFNKNTGLKVDFIPDFYAKYVGILMKAKLPNKPYILMPSGGKKLSAIKDWGFDKFHQLSKLLRNEFDIVQIGEKGDKILPYANKYYLDVDLGVMAYLMKFCQAFVGISNGLSVFAGHHDIKSFILYSPKNKDKPRNKYRNQIQLDFDSPDKIYSIIIRSLFNVSD